MNNLICLFCQWKGQIIELPLPKKTQEDGLLLKKPFSSVWVQNVSSLKYLIIFSE